MPRSRSYSPVQAPVAFYCQLRLLNSMRLPSVPLDHVTHKYLASLWQIKPARLNNHLSIARKSLFCRPKVSIYIQIPILIHKTLPWLDSQSRLPRTHTIGIASPRISINYRLHSTRVPSQDIRTMPSSSTFHFLACPTRFEFAFSSSPSKHHMAWCYCQHMASDQRRNVSTAMASSVPRDKP